ncbi:unnamed protein product [Peronospora farinosa]|uniref:Uncharacterized protein n=1 Tax=Peronospora farinosa TaxID=134698 RepID=A0AAV0UVF8_9STRA|nr:unnamed protein product [Peronospora farinosa]CAI5738609.1 unnamed protein product [Peronospora farinosa]
MKRSRACDDLVALAAETSDDTSKNSDILHCNQDTWTSFVEGPTTHRLKRSRAAGSSSSNEAEDQEVQMRDSLQFVLDMKDLEEMTMSSTLSVQDDDTLPLRRNSREKMLLQKKKQRITEITSSFKDCSIHDKDARNLHHPPSRLTKPEFMETPETPEPRILRGLCYPRKTRCIDPLDKRQAQSFDMSALIMLSLSPKR